MAHAMIRPRESVLEDGTVQAAVRRLHDMARRVFTELRDLTKRFAAANGLDDWTAPWRLTLPVISTWSKPTLNTMAAEFIALSDHIEEAFDKAYVLYCRKNFGTTPTGDINVLQVTKPLFADMYHACLIRLAASPEMNLLHFFDNLPDAVRACENALCDALRDMAIPRVRVTRTIPAEEARAARAGMLIPPVPASEAPVMFDIPALPSGSARRKSSREDTESTPVAVFNDGASQQGQEWLRTLETSAKQPALKPPRRPVGPGDSASQVNSLGVTYQREQRASITADLTPLPPLPSSTKDAPYLPPPLTSSGARKVRLTPAVAASPAVSTGSVLPPEIAVHQVPDASSRASVILSNPQLSIE